MNKSLTKLHFYSAINSTEVEPFEDIAEFEYIKDSLITQQEKESLLEIFVGDVKDVFNGKFDGSDIVQYPYTHFMGLPFKYKSILEGGVRYPSYETKDLSSPMKRTGVGKELVLSHFIDDPKIDRVIFQPKKGGKLSDLIDRISNNSYWKGVDIDSAYILSCNGRAFPRHKYVMTIEFNDIHKHVLGPWTGRIHENMELWSKIKHMILNFDGDYVKLLESIVRIPV